MGIIVDKAATLAVQRHSCLNGGNELQMITTLIFHKTRINTSGDQEKSRICTPCLSSNRTLRPLLQLPSSFSSSTCEFFIHMLPRWSVLHGHYITEERVSVLTAFSASSMDSYSTKACNCKNIKH